jgi:hypothetical protein
LTLVDLVVWIFYVLTQLQQKLGFVLEEFKEPEIVLLGIKSDCSWSSLSSFINLFDQGIDGFASLYRDIFILLYEEGVEFIEEVGVVLGGD